MKRILNVYLLSSVVALGMAWTSCERCATCERYDVQRDSTFTSEICNNRQKVFNDEIRVYEKNGYSCTTD